MFIFVIQRQERQEIFHVIVQPSLLDGDNIAMSIEKQLDLGN